MPRQVRPPVLVSFAAFVLVGISAGVSGVLLPSQMATYGADRATIGITFFATSAGFVLGGLSTGALIHRLGVRVALAAGGAAFVLAGLYLATRPPFVAFAAAQLVTGYGVAAHLGGQCGDVRRSPGPQDQRWLAAHRRHAQLREPQPVRHARDSAGPLSWRSTGFF